MKTNKFLLLLICFTCCSYIGFKSNTINNDSLEFIADTIQRIEKIDTIYFSMERNNSHNLGFKKQELGAALGIAGICLNNNFLYISDNYYGNIKKVNLESGKIELSSSVIDKEYKDLGSLFYQNDTLICLSTFQDKIYYLNSELKVIEIKKLRKSYKEFRISNDKLYIYSALEGKKLFDSQLNYSTVVPLSLPPFSFTEFNCGYGKCLKNRFGIFQIKKEINHVQFLDVKNVTFDKKTIVYFDDSAKDKYTFIVLKYYSAK